MQLTREWPPGYGGVERMVHAVAEGWLEMGGACVTVSLRAPLAGCGEDPLPVGYSRRQLRSWAWGDLLLPLPCRTLAVLLLSADPLLVHLPCPTVLALAMVAKLLRPQRRIGVLWHAFLDPRLAGWKGRLLAAYQRLAFWWVASGPDRLITTSGRLAEELARSCGVSSARLALLPCCLGADAEARAAAIWNRRQEAGVQRSPAGRVIYIGRLDSYKRVDWLIDACCQLKLGRLDVIGAGVKRQNLERLAETATAASGETRIIFHGRLNESDKYALLSEADLLVLPSDSCHEAFGIVQLEAMACGLPALSFDLPRSGMAWVNNLSQGKVVPPRRQQDLAAAIEAVLQIESYATICNASRVRFEDVFSRKVWRQRLRDLKL